MPTDAATRIRLRRQQLGWTQAELAAKVGVHPATVTSWESGTFPKRHQGKVEAVLGIAIEGGDIEPLDENEEAIRAMHWLTTAEQDELLTQYRRRRPLGRAG